MLQEVKPRRPRRSERWTDAAGLVAREQKMMIADEKREAALLAFLGSQAADYEVLAPADREVRTNTREQFIKCKAPYLFPSKPSGSCDSLPMLPMLMEALELNRSEVERKAGVRDYSLDQETMTRSGSIRVTRVLLARYRSLALMGRTWHPWITSFLRDCLGDPS